MVSENHKKNYEAACGTQRTTSFFENRRDERVIHAETKFVYVGGENYEPFSTCNGFSNTVIEMSPNGDWPKKY